MLGRARVLLLCLVALAPAAFARVLSYAPYTNRAATSSIHHREGRWFALTEQVPASYSEEVVLYDALGLEEPRVIFPAGPRTIYYVAIWESRWATASVNYVPPQILISTYESTPTYTQVYYLSVDGGKTFAKSAVTGYITSLFQEVDYGSSYSHGLTTSVLVGDVFSFVVSTTDGVWAIDHDGKAKLLAPAGYTLVGRDRTGSRMLVRTNSSLWTVDGNGTLTWVGDFPTGNVLNGWITSDGSVYVQTSAGTNRYLWFLRGGVRTLIGAPYGVTPATTAPIGATDLSFFGVPANDYDGAWMIQRGSGKPTTLLRHTAAGVETMWTDISGPEVEALHTGASGNNLLIQVHRPRAAEERWIIDPALALWQIGQPAPRTYDELFLNETWSKGFTHLNVDAIAGGAPFIFDSGRVNGAITSPGGGGGAGGGGGGDVMQEWGVVRASLKQRLVVPGVARQAGAYGSYWLTDLVIHNPLAETQTVKVRYVPLGGDVQTQAIYEKTLSLAPKEIRVVKDVLQSLYGFEQGGGVLYLDPASAVSATARTYTRAGEGSFGFGMQAIDAMNAAGPRFPVTFAGAFPGPEYRTNMLLTDTSGRGTEARLQAHGLSGVIGVDDVAFSAPNDGAQQMQGIATSLGLTPSDAGGLEVHPTRGSLIATVVAMDNRTNDPTFFPPDLPAPVVRTIPAIGHLDGANGAKFRSDLYLLNPSSVARTVTLEARTWDQPIVMRQPFTLLPGEARVIRDALKTMFGLEGIARLRYSSFDSIGGEGVRVTSRAYNINEDGGTFGCLVPPFNAFQSAGPGETLEILGVMGGSGFRTNIGLLELSGGGGTNQGEARIRIVNESGVQLDAFTVKLALGGATQLNDVFSARNIPYPAAAMIYVDVVQGLIGAYATLTDNVTNDSTYLGASLGARPD